MNKVEEAKTVRERTITVKLSDADCIRILEQAGSANLTVGELLANFIGDLVNGTHTNGSDERMYAEQWFERCWFGMFPDDTLLRHLLTYGYDPEEYLKSAGDLANAMEERQRMIEHPKEGDAEELKNLEGNILSLQEELNDMTCDWNQKTKSNIEDELKQLRAWVDEKNSLLGDNAEEKRKSPEN